MLRQPRDRPLGNSGACLLVVFDLLEVGGEDLRGRPLSERTSVLHAYSFPAHGVRAIEHVETHGEALFREVATHDQEGLVAKRLDAPYLAKTPGHVG